MGIKMNTYAGGQMTAGNDAILHDRAIANTGILHGCNITFMGANQIHIEKGYLLIKGRYCTVTEDTIQVAMSNSETELPGRLYVRADLADAQEPVKILSVAADPLPKLTQDENINYDNGVWEMELATYTAGMTAIKDLTVTCEEVPEGASKKETAALLGKIDELTEKIPNPVLLWENPNPTQRFPVDGTIELSSDDYNWLEIYYYSNTTSNGLLYQKVKKGDIPILMHTHFTSSGSGFGYRALQYVDDTHLKGTGYSIRQYFSNNVTPQFDNKATTYGIPVKIYGIK